MRYLFSFLFLFTAIASVYAQDGQLMPYPKNEKIFIYLCRRPQSAGRAKKVETSATSTPSSSSSSTWTWPRRAPKATSTGIAATRNSWLGVRDKATSKQLAEVDLSKKKGQSVLVLYNHRFQVRMQCIKCLGTLERSFFVLVGLPGQGVFIGD